MQLMNTDLHFCLSRLPKDIRNLLQKYPLFVAGGFLRSTISGEKPKDIDIFGPDIATLKAAAQDLCIKRGGRLHESKNAITLFQPPRQPVQFIFRWTFNNIDAVVNSFDYTVCQAAICFWHSGPLAKGKYQGEWRSCCADRFYPDLAARRLTYTSPARNEDAGGSMMRLRKFLQRGYTIQAPSMAAVIARLVSKIRLEHIADMANGDEMAMAKLITNLLREVDPLAVVDGCELLDEHEIITVEDAV